MKSRLILGCVLSCLICLQLRAGEQQFFPAFHPDIRYTGRIDFSNPLLPRFWQPGVYIEARFTGNVCGIILQDEQLWGKNHNYIEIVVDGQAQRLQTRNQRDTLFISGALGEGPHSLLICKNTEANIGYLEFAGLLCEALAKPAPPSIRKIECIGNSITCGTGSDQSAVPCGAGLWQDQHNAYMSYGAVTARNLYAQYHLSSVSGIGLMHSCCDLDITMPQVFDKTDMRNDRIEWDFKRYTPDVVTICLGQNDGIQDKKKFIARYKAFIRQLRKHYPHAALICLSSPMADDQLKAFMEATLATLVSDLQASGDKKVFYYIFSKQYKNGCDWHPDLDEHRQIAEELTTFIRFAMHW